MKQKRMKVSLLSMTLVVALLGLSMNAFGQRGGMMKRDFPRKANPQQVGIEMLKKQLTEEQFNQITELRDQHLADMKTIRLQLAEKQAHLRTLLGAEQHDSKAIDRTIDQIGALKTQMMKQGVAHREAVAKILTPEQQKLIRSHFYGRGMGMGISGQQGMRPMKPMGQFGQGRGGQRFYQRQGRGGRRFGGGWNR